MTTRRALALEVWRSHLNTPYRWGGDDPLDGFDCSGFVVEGLQSAGLLPRGSDASADHLMRVVYGTSPRIENPAGLQPGCLLFWGTPAKATHVEVVYAMVNAQPFTIGASGGGSRTTDRRAAVEQNAYIKIRPARPGWLAAVDPFV